MSWNRVGLFTSVLLAFIAALPAPALAALDAYGVVVGTPTTYGLEPRTSEGRWPHYVVNVQTPQGNYRAVINVFNRDDEPVMHRILDIPYSAEAAWTYLNALPNGLTELPFGAQPNAATAGALDLARDSGILATIQGHPWSNAQWVDEFGDIPEIDALLQDATRVYIFGEPYFNADGTKGIHDVHQNQGNMPGTSFSVLNDRWQDGGMVIEYPPTSVFRIGVGHIEYANRKLLLTRFQVQRDFSDVNGDGVNATTHSYTDEYARAGAPVTYGPFSARQIQARLTNIVGDPRVTLSWTQLGFTRSVSSDNAYEIDEFVRAYSAPTWSQFTIQVHSNTKSSRWDIAIEHTFDR